MTDKHDDLPALRAEFEAKFGPCLLRNNTPGPDQGVYLDPFTNYAWRAWQAAYSAGQRAAAVRAAEVCMEQAKEPECPERAAYCADAILRDAGIDKEQGNG